MQPNYDGYDADLSYAYEELKRVRAQRDDLLAACEALLSFIKGHDMGGDWYQENYPAIQQARAAIAAVRAPETKGD